MEKQKQQDFSPNSLSEFFEYNFLQNNTLYISEELQDLTSSFYVSALEFLADKTNNIRIIITSPGGDVLSAFAIYDTIQSIRARKIKVTTEARGYAASAAVLILQAGDCRVATKNTRILIHEVRTINVTDETRPSDAEESLQELKIVNDMVVEVLAGRTNKSVEEIKRLWRKTDLWMSADEAKEFGLIDEVV